jgi:hypothetical protein
MSVEGVKYVINRYKTEQSIAHQSFASIKRFHWNHGLMMLGWLTIAVRGTHGSPPKTSLMAGGTLTKHLLHSPKSTHFLLKLTER